ncbi:MAG: hypothetical protein XD92_0149 [Proteiniphilum acetatigenes]|uniref:TonB-dependent receptor n=1 Tax=Proteiniphilum acetatigenes TaxID=294710 RepID=A0A101HKU0_9BACT|nr:MAG: hypothetical protein XD92_0149 [Proteiniphilum acetatigenes]
MKSMLLLASSLLITVSAFAGTESNEAKKENESQPAAPVEMVQTLQLTGSVVDEKNQEALAGAAIVVDGRKYYSDLDGNFAIKNVKPGRYSVMVELISYESATMEVDLSGSNRELKIGLLQK